MKIELVKALAKMEYIGKMKMENDGSFSMNYMNGIQSPHGYFRSMGDIVYFMIVKGRLMKIGKAGGINGWYGRFSMYGKGLLKGGDRTNKRIHAKMLELKRKGIDIFVLPVKRKTVKTKCNLTDKLLRVHVPMNGEIEDHLFHTFKNEPLLFCQQKGGI